MSRNFKHGLRKNPDVAAIARWAEAKGIYIELQPPAGKGHPRCVMTRGPISCYVTVGNSPQRRIRVKNAVGAAKRAWRRAEEMHGDSD